MNTHTNNGGNYNRFTERNHRELYNRYEGENHNRFENREGNRVDHGIRVGKGNLGNFRHGIVGGNFFEHGRHFGFRRFWNDQWVFLTAWDSCTAWAWVNVAPGAWAWTPIDICIG
jgi:ribosomal protein L15